MAHGVGVIGYASNTGTRRNLDALRAAGWRLLLTPDNPTRREGLMYGIDNGAWRAYQRNEPFDERSFLRLFDRSAEDADFVIVPDIVAGGMRSLDFSLSWLPRLSKAKKLLLPVQDGMDVFTVASVLHENPSLGIFLGGSTEWKLRTMYEWGELSAVMDRHYHVGRVNTARRIRLAAEAGADSFDGTSATRFSNTLPLLESARKKRSLLSPRKSKDDSSTEDKELPSGQIISLAFSQMLVTVWIRRTVTLLIFIHCVGVLRKLCVAHFCAIGALHENSPRSWSRTIHRSPSFYGTRCKATQPSLFDPRGSTAVSSLLAAIVRIEPSLLNGGLALAY